VVVGVLDGEEPTIGLFGGIGIILVGVALVRGGGRPAPRLDASMVEKLHALDKDQAIVRSYAKDAQRELCRKEGG
jgi:hypothetical protein